MDTYLATDSTDPDANRAMREWLSMKLYGRTNGFSGPCSTMGVFDQGRLVGVVLYNNYHPEPGTIEVHGAAETPRWLTRRVLYEMYDFPFNKLGCQTVIQRNDPDDKKLARILHTLGFKSFLIPRLRGRDKDELVFVLHDDVWRNSRFNKRGNRHGR